VKVIVENNEVEKAIKTLKKKLSKEGLLKEIKRRSFYEKPSTKRKRKKKEAIKARNKRLKKLGLL
jgi:small subunit ribosomal protein S21